MTTIEQIGRHYLSEVQYPSQDSEQWLAWLSLNNLYPTTSYWSMDGYHVHALVDYDRNILWEDDKITTTDRSELICGVTIVPLSTIPNVLKFAKLWNPKESV